MSLEQEVELIRQFPIFAQIQPAMQKLLCFSAERLTIPEPSRPAASPPERMEVTSGAEPSSRPLPKPRSMAIVSRAPVISPHGAAEPFSLSLAELFRPV